MHGPQVGLIGIESGGHGEEAVNALELGQGRFYAQATQVLHRGQDGQHLGEVVPSLAESGKDFVDNPTLEGFGFGFAAG